MTSALKHRHESLMRRLVSKFKESRFGLDERTRAHRLRAEIRRLYFEIRVKVPSTEYENHLAWLHQRFGFIFSSADRGDLGYDSIDRLVESRRIPLVSEIRWACARVSAECAKISYYIELRREAIDGCWSGNSARALQALDDIDALFGQSLWAISARVSIIQWFSGIEQQKAYSATLKKLLGRGAAAFVAHYVSVRNEPSVSHRVFGERARNWIANAATSKAIQDFLTNQLLGDFPATDEGKADVLRLSENFSLIDIYETLIALLQNEATSVRGLSEGEFLLVEGLTRTLPDPRLVKLTHMRASQALDSSSLSSINSLLCGNVVKAASSAIAEFKRGMPTLDAVAVAAFALGCRKRKYQELRQRARGAPWRFVVDRVRTTLVRGELAATAAEELAKFGRNFVWSSRATAAVLLAKSSADSSIWRGSARNIAIHTANTGLMEALSSQLAFTGSRGDALINLTQALLGEDASNLIDESRDFLAALHALAKGEDAHAIPHLRVLSQVEFPSVRATVVALLIPLLRAENQISELLTLVAREVAVHLTPASTLPLSEAMAGLTWKELRPFAADLATVISIHAWSLDGDDDRTLSLTRFAFEAFLRSQTVPRASELKRIATRFRPAELIHFWRHVCTASVMDMSAGLPDSRAVQLELREILGRLSEFDPSGSQIYNEEILAITHWLRIQEGVQLVDRSRVHVDTYAIKLALGAELRESFERYVALVDAGVGVAEDFSVVLRAAEKRDLSGKQFEVPTNEADDLLVAMFRRLSEQFLSSPVHGLDSYLSKRVRHDSLVGHLRGPLDDRKLLTQRDVGGTYAINQYWLSRLDDLDPWQRNELANAFASFAERVDSELLRLKEQVLHIRSREHSNGIFSLTLEPTTFHLLRSALKTDLTIDGFFETVFAALWGILELSLVRARSVIRQETASNLNQAVDQFRADASRIAVSAKGYPELSQCIGDAWRDTQVALDTVASWFSRVETEHGVKRYSLPEAVSVAIESVRSVHKSLPEKLELELADNIVIPAAGLPVLADVLFATLGNAAKHGSPNGLTNVKVTAALAPDGKVLLFVVASVTERASRTPIVEAKIESIRRQIEDGTFLDRVRKEGQSGLIKLAAIVKQSRDGSLDFGFVDERTFVVNCSLAFIISSDGGSSVA